MFGYLNSVLCSCGRVLLDSYKSTDVSVCDQSRCRWYAGENAGDVPVRFAIEGKYRATDQSEGR